MKIRPLSVVFNIFAIITVIAVAFTLFNVFSGAKGYAVVTDSMAPQLKRGDIVFVKTVEFESLKESDVVTVAFPDRDGYFTHRIVSIDYEFGIIRTKGDASDQEDPQPSLKEQVVGKLWYSVPLLGYFSIFFKSLNYIKISVILAVITIVLVTAATIVQKSRKSERKDDSNEQV